MANHERNFRNYFLYHFTFEERRNDWEKPEKLHEYYSAKGSKRALERFRRSYPYEKYRIVEVCRVLSFKDAKVGEKL